MRQVNRQPPRGRRARGPTGISRVEYIRRRLAADAATARAPVSVQDPREFADRVADLANDEVMNAAWR